MESVQNSETFSSAWRGECVQYSAGMLSFQVDDFVHESTSQPMQKRPLGGSAAAHLKHSVRKGRL